MPWPAPQQGQPPTTRAQALRRQNCWPGLHAATPRGLAPVPHPGAGPCSLLPVVSAGMIFEFRSLWAQRPISRPSASPLEDVNRVPSRLTPGQPQGSKVAGGPSQHLPGSQQARAVFLAEAAIRGWRGEGPPCAGPLAIGQEPGLLQPGPSSLGSPRSRFPGALVLSLCFPSEHSRSTFALAVGACGFNENDS